MSTPRRKPVRLSVTALEDRATPTVTSSFAGGVLTITSDGAADSVRVFRQGNTGSDYFYLANGVRSATFSGVTAVTVNGGDGADVLDASGVDTPVPYDWRKTAVSASSWYNVNYDPTWAFNGAGLNADLTHSSTGADGYFGAAGWLSPNLADVDGQYVQIYLGDAVAVNKLLVWNYNQSYAGVSYGNRGVRTADVLVSTDGTTWTTAAAGVTLTRAPGTGGYNTPDAVYLPGAPVAKYVRLVVRSNFGSDAFGNYVGLSELQVYGRPATATVMGARISPAAVTASTTYPGLSPVHAGNGYGLNPFRPSWHDTDYAYAWLSTSQADVAGQYMQFDLGAVGPLDRVRVWNYNQVYGTPYTMRGIKDAQVQFSTDGVTYTTVLSTTFPQATGRADYQGFDVDLTGLGSTRFVRLVALSNYGSDSWGNFAGLSEVMFFSSVPAPVAPVPVTIDGGLGDDTITGGFGPDTLTGDGGLDVFTVVPTATTTQDVVTDFTDGVDRLNLKAFGVTAFDTGPNSLIAQGGTATQVGPDVVITLPPAYGTKSLRLANFLLPQLDDADFVP